jgi:hypothetical protein
MSTPSLVYATLGGGDDPSHLQLLGDLFCDDTGAGAGTRISAWVAKSARESFACLGTHVMDEPVAVGGSEGEHELDVEAFGVVDAAGDGRDGGYARAAAHGFAGDSPADLAEAFESDGEAVQGADGGLGTGDDAEAGDEVFQRCAVDGCAHHVWRLVRIPQGGEVVVVRAEVGASEELAGPSERQDLLAVALHDLVLVFGFTADGALSAPSLAAENGELVRHRASQELGLALRDVRGVSSAARAHAGIVKLKRDEPVNRVEPPNLLERR